MLFSLIYLVTLVIGKEPTIPCYFPSQQNQENNNTSHQNKKSIDTLLKDYENTNQELERRQHITLIVGSILVAASFFIVGQTVFAIDENKVVFAAFASIFLYFLWLFGLHLTTKHLDDIAYARIRGIEEKISTLRGYQFGIHTFHKRNKRWWLWFRRRFWGWIYLFLCTYWILYSKGWQNDNWITMIKIICSFAVILVIFNRYPKLKEYLSSKPSLIVTESSIDENSFKVKIKNKGKGSATNVELKWIIYEPKTTRIIYDSDDPILVIGELSEGGEKEYPNEEYSHERSMEFPTPLRAAYELEIRIQCSEGVFNEERIILKKQNSHYNYKRNCN